MTQNTVIFSCGNEMTFSGNYYDLFDTVPFSKRKKRNKSAYIYKVEMTRKQFWYDNNLNAEENDHSPMPENIVQLADFVRKNSSDDQVRRFCYGHFDTDESFDAIILPFAR